MKKVSVMLALLVVFLTVFTFSKEINSDSKRPNLKKSGYLGDPEAKDLNYSFVEPSSIAADSKGNFYVLETGACIIKKFDKNLKYLKTISGKGSGPGELKMPESIEIGGNDNIYIGDPGKGCIEVISSEGKYVKTIKMKSTNIQFKLLKDGKIVLRNPNLDGGRGLKEGNVPLYKILDNEGKELKSIGQGIYFTKPPYNQGGNRLWFNLDKNGNIYSGYLFQNKIDIHNQDNKLVNSIQIDVNKKKQINKNPEMYTTINSGIEIDSKGRIWYLKHNRLEKPEEKVSTEMIFKDGEISKNIKYDKELAGTDMYSLEVYDSNGKMINTIKLDHFCDRMKIIDDKIYIVDSLREMKFYIYKIEN